MGICDHLQGAIKRRRIPCRAYNIPCLTSRRQLRRQLFLSACKRLKLSAVALAAQSVVVSVASKLHDGDD